MKILPKQELTNLHLVNTLFADLTGSDLYLAKQIKDAIDASLQADSTRTSSKPFFTQAINKLTHHHLYDTPASTGFRFCNAAPNGEALNLLWLRAEMLKQIKQLIRFKEATLIITNLKKAICPKGKRWTKKRQQEYDDTLFYLRTFSCSRIPSNTRLTLLFY
ncbi:MAG: hypothetical protein JKY51_09665 [Opitutaceae bacterium]|nr:hypothetical protein [Opitutaceae bacterium]